MGFDLQALMLVHGLIPSLSHSNAFPLAFRYGSSPIVFIIFLLNLFIHFYSFLLLFFKNVASYVKDIF